MKYIALLCLVTLLSACATSFEELGSKIDKTLGTTKTDELTQEIQREPQLPSLTIVAHPVGSTIKIMNIKPKYHDGIVLESGTYDILVQKEGYSPYREYIQVSHHAVVQQVTLKPLSQEALASSTQTSVAKTTQDQTPVQPSSTNIVSKPSKAIEKTETKTVAVTSEPKKKTNKVTPTKAKPPATTNTKRADYLPPELAQASKLEPAEMTSEQQPQFNGAYIKTIDEGFISDTVELLEMKSAPAYRSVVFRSADDESVSITWLLKQKKKHFALDIQGTISLPIQKFKGIIAKGEATEFISLHPAEKWVRGYSKDGKKTGETTTMFDSTKHVDVGQAIYVPAEELKIKKAQTGNDSHFIDFKQKPKKGLYVVWINSQFWFFNLI